MNFHKCSWLLLSWYTVYESSYTLASGNSRTARCATTDTMSINTMALVMMLQFCARIERTLTQNALRKPWTAADFCEQLCIATSIDACTWSCSLETHVCLYEYRRTRNMECTLVYRTKACICVCGMLHVYLSIRYILAYTHTYTLCNSA